ncbi:MAG: tetratricopeptide repeat protein [Phycisphaerales bacterium]|nr:tetratricopeptide repeat protein [Phycisphaerales bacterium]MCB9855953.1 tetratricopeptide repeat protein [Phycisphaerales bacterium]MCB9864066.1 tetratricopeptide repeat protein [Phycisphaerales bacterium]
MNQQSKRQIMVRCAVCAAAVLVIPACRDADNSSSTRSIEPTRIPQPRVESIESCGRIAHLDLAALQDWCRENGLPPPPNVRECEPGIADALTKGLANAAKRQSDAGFGLVGQVSYVLQDFDAARAYLTLAAEANPREGRWPYYLGAVAQDIGSTEVAIEQLERALKLNADLAMAHARLGQLFLDSGDLDAAWKHAERYARMMTRDSLGYVLLGRIMIERADAAEAVRYLEAAVDKSPSDFQAVHYLGKAYLKLGQMDEAQERLQFASTLPKGNWFNSRDPLWAEALDASGSSMGLVRQLEAILATRQWEDMASLMERIIELRAGDFKMMANLADVYRKLGRYDDAHRMLDQAQRIEPTLSELHSKRAALFLAEQKYPEALAAADLAIAGAGSDVQPWSVRGRALFILKRYAEAEVALRKVVELNGADAQGWHLLGVSLHALGRADEAADCFHRVLSLINSPDDPLVKSATQNLALIAAESEKNQ